jgi:glycylpeptide N-tetradecanoyltransferase
MKRLDFYFKLEMDVFNALDLMDNQEFLQELKFGIGDGNLQYYVYNWKCPMMPPNKVKITSIIIK